MKSKIIAISCAIILMVCCVLFNVISSSKVISENEKKVLEEKDSEVLKKEESKTDEEKEKKPEVTKKVAIVYFSVTGSTKKVAEYINDKIGGTLFEIKAKDAYTDSDLNYSSVYSRSAVESKDDSVRPELKEEIKLDGYDIIYLGYPIWYDSVPKIILTFIDTTNISGKTVIPFCTSQSTDITNSLSYLKKYKTDVKWVNGKRLKDNRDEVLSWVSGLQY